MPQLHGPYLWRACTQSSTPAPPLPVHVLSPEQAFFGDVLQEATRFLDRYPSEFILIRVKDEVGRGNGEVAGFHDI